MVRPELVEIGLLALSVVLGIVARRYRNEAGALANRLSKLIDEPSEVEQVVDEVRQAQNTEEWHSLVAYYPALARLEVRDEETGEKLE